MLASVADSAELSWPSHGSRNKHHDRLTMFRILVQSCLIHYSRLFDYDTEVKSAFFPLTIYDNGNIHCVNANDNSYGNTRKNGGVIETEIQ
jgi:hypothetical protein